MGSKNKLKRFRDNESFDNVLQPSREEVIAGLDHKGRWREFFGNDNPIVLELGCGKGEYSIALAKKFPEKNFIGIDIKGARFWRGAKTAIEDNLSNVAFIRTQIELIDYIFSPGEISEIWITFPDPQIKYKRTKHRLTNSVFLDKFRSVLSKEGSIHLKTDSEFMHGYTLGLLHGQGHTIHYSHHDVYSNAYSPELVTGTQTFYEKQYLEKDKAITYIHFSLKDKIE